MHAQFTHNAHTIHTTEVGLGGKKADVFSKAHEIASSRQMKQSHLF